MNNKLLIVGLDGATFNIIKPGVDKGFLPNLKELMKTGTSGILKSTIPAVTPPAWTSFTTCVNPGVHGIYDFIRINKDYEFDINTSLNKKARDVWDLVNGKSIIINVPITYPPRKLNGQLITGMLTPDTKSDFTYPQKLKKEITTKFPDYKITLQWELYGDKKEKFLEDLYAMTRERFRVSMYMLKKEWQLFFTVFIGTDRIQHLFWDDCELMRYYQKLDEYIGEFLEHIDENTDFLIVSDHGFQRIDKLLLCNSWLKNEGYLSIKKEGFLKDLMKRLGLRKRNIKKLLSTIGVDVTSLTRKMPMKFKAMIPEEGGSVYQNIDWSKTKAFMMGFGLVFINTKERFSKGVVSQEAYDNTRDELITKLKKIKDPKTGERIVREVYKKEDIYSGKHTSGAPDMVIELKEGYAFSKKIKNEYLEESGAMKADHHPDGIFICNRKLKKKQFAIEEILGEFI